MKERILGIMLGLCLASTAGAQMITVDFDTDDVGGVIVNGKKVESPPGAVFGTYFTLTSTGNNLGAAAFDTDPNGPNAGGPDPDLLIDQGNVVILQSSSNPTMVGDVFTIPNDSAAGGTMLYDFAPAIALGFHVLVDTIDVVDRDTNGRSIITLTDESGFTRVVTVPNNFTGEVTNGDPGVATIDLSSGSPTESPNVAGLFTTVNTDPGFDIDNVVSVLVNFIGSGALDNFAFVLRECIDDAECVDGDLCTQDLCTDNVCTNPPVDCPRRGTSCDPDTGNCVECFNDIDCSDGLYCNGAETCDPNGACQPGTPPDCDDGSACTVDSCDEDTDMCVNTETTCPDSGDPCTILECDPTGDPGNCDITSPRGEDDPCDDGDPCTTDEVCSGGTCGGGVPVTCPDSGDPCTILECDPTGDPGNCDITSPRGEDDPCDDGDPCTTDEVCSGGTCGGGVPVTCPDSGDPCTILSCDPTGDPGNCDITSPRGEDDPCDDGDPCTTDEVCSGGTCGGGVPVTCPDSGDPCTILECDPTGDPGNCDITSPRGEDDPCDDGDPCTTDEVCSGGTCGGGVPVTCPDSGDPCTILSCDPTGDPGNCDISSPRGEDDPCDDGDPCTTDEVCSGGTCGGGVPVTCPDSGDPCTILSCDPTGDPGNCDISSPRGENDPCDDGNACTTGETCTGGNCAGGQQVDCSFLDGICTVGVCNPATGTCSAQPANVGGSCDDGNECTENDMCTPNGTCGGTPIDGCEDAPPVPTVGRWGMLLLILALVAGLVIRGNRRREMDA